MPERCTNCNGYPSTANPGRTFKVCMCPASVTTLPLPTLAAAPDLPETLEEQVRALLPTMPETDRLPFLAGMRFAQGFAEYGNGLFRCTPEKREYERLCEEADAYNMRRVDEWEAQQ